MLYDKKDEIKFDKKISFPFTAVNFNRETKLCYSKEEVYKHVVCKVELKPIIQLLTAKVHPELFITEDSYTLISHYMRFKRYGMQFLYPRGIGKTPNLVLQAFDIISNVIDKAESDMIKASKQNSKKTENNKNTKK